MGNFQCCKKEIENSCIGTRLNTYQIEDKSEEEEHNSERAKNSTVPENNPTFAVGRESQRINFGSTKIQDTSKFSFMLDHRGMTTDLKFSSGLHDDNLVKSSSDKKSFLKASTTLTDLTKKLGIQVITRKNGYRFLPKIKDEKLKFAPYLRTNETPTVSFGKLPSGLIIAEDLPVVPQPNELVSSLLTEEQIIFVEKHLKEEGILNADTESKIIEEILSKVSYFKILPNTVIYSKGSNENLYYIIESGKIQYTVDKRIDYLIKGDSISTEDLEKNSDFECTVKTLDTTFLFSLQLESSKSSFKSLSLKDQNEKIKVLSTIPVFKYLEKHLITALAGKMKKSCYQDIIVSDSDIPDKLYIIIEGSVLCIKDDKEVKRLGPKDLFCDTQIFLYAESYYNYVAEDHVLVYELVYDVMSLVLGRNYMLKLIVGLFTHTILKSEQLSKCLNHKIIPKVIEVFQLKYYFKDTIYDSKREKKIFVVVSGSCSKSSKSKEEDTFTTVNEVLQCGDFFGEEILDSVETEESSIIFSEDECVVFEASWTDILKSIYCQTSPISFNSTNNKLINNESLYDRVIVLKKIPLFTKISDLKLFSLAELLKKHRFKKNDVIIKDGPISDKMYIIKSGRVKVISNHAVVKELDKGTIFGDIITMSNESKKLSFVVKEKCECYVLHKDNYEEVIDSSMLEPLQKILVLKDITITLDQLYFLKEIGAGSFGKVYLVHNKKSLYAVKTSEIQFLCKYKHLTQYYLNEKSVMSSIDHPFIVQLVNTLKSPSHIFFLMEYIDGITLKEYIKNKTPNSHKNLKESVFYIAIILVVINYLHKNKIIHRDIKPDNIMIDKSGYLKMIDFGTSKILSERDFTNTILGTPHYMAPETLLGRPYSFSVDYWACGVILYEIFYGILPFGHDVPDLCEVYKEIIERKIVLPKDPKCEEFNEFIELLLAKNENKRVCSFKKLISHKIFSTLDFKKLLEYNLPPPFTPKPSNSDPDLLKNTSWPFLNIIKTQIIHTNIDLHTEDEDNIRDVQTDLFSQF